MIMLDLNVMLDVVQKREPHYQASAVILNRVVSAGLRACVPGHALTTLLSRK
jgi:predicted nucleic acid-binding protein